MLVSKQEVRAYSSGVLPVDNHLVFGGSSIRDVAKSIEATLEAGKVVIEVPLIIVRKGAEAKTYLSDRAPRIGSKSLGSGYQTSHKTSKSVGSVQEVLQQVRVFEIESHKLSEEKLNS